jgi:ABC-type arginine/histidine transport system permease subunit
MVFEKDGKRKSFPKGFSWTVIFFGFWVPIFRRDPRHTVLFLIFYGSMGGLAQVLQTDLLRAMLLYGYLAAACYVAWNYNRWYAAQLRREGYHEVETLSPPDEVTAG